LIDLIVFGPKLPNWARREKKEAPYHSFMVLSPSLTHSLQQRAITKDYRELPVLECRMVQTINQIKSIWDTEIDLIDGKSAQAYRTGYAA
jgi:hypothetical protein